jgi:hypothetical protein
MRISKKVLCAGAVIVFGTALEASAQTGAGKIRACVLPTGGTRIVGSYEPCKSNESLLEWNVAGAPGPQGPQGPDGPQGPAGSGSGGVKVVNASGGEVGSLLDRDTAVLTLPSGRKSYAQLFVAGRGPGATLTNYYGTTDCSGDAYVSWSNFEELVPATIVLDAGAFSVVPGSTAPRAVKAKRVFGDAGLGGCQTVTQMTLPTSRFDFYLPSQLNLFYPLSVQ